uniref:Uncharacterized protein n=1 Tax=Plectus sambesii TaxID=2011161 RepID=A0A914VDY7_9BILA
MSEVGDETEATDANTTFKNDTSELNVGDANNATSAPSTTRAPRRTKPNVFLALESFIEHSNISLEELVEKAEIEYHKITWERVQLNVSVDELRQKFGYEVQCFFASGSFFIQHSVFRKGSYGSEETDDGIISLGRTTFVDYNQVCLQLIDPYEFRVKQDVLRISFEARPLQQGGEIYPFYMEVAEAANNVDDSRTYTIDLAGRDTVVFDQADKTDNVIKGRLGENRMASVSISAVYRALSVVRNERRCHDEKSADDCKSECRFNTISHFYNCTPTSWPALAPSDGGRCSIAKFIKYRDYNETELYSCMDACLERCTTWRFQIEETIRGTYIVS